MKKRGNLIQGSRETRKILVKYLGFNLTGQKYYALRSSVQFSHSVMSNPLRPHESQHSRPTCPSPTPRVHSDSRPSSQWCHPGISSSVVPFFSCPWSLPASKSFPMSQLFTWGTGVSALASRFHIYALICLFFSFWLTLLYRTGSRFIYFITMDSNLFLLMAE